jgi:putative membrane protein
MHALRWTILGASALALAACGHKTETATTNVTSDTSVNQTVVAPAAAPGQDFANTAASSDAFEIASSQLAATQGKSPAVKKFASEMIAAHTDSTAKLKAAAGVAAQPVTPDPTLTAEQQQTLDSLKPLIGADFDKAYAAAQVDAHQKTLDALKAYSASGDVPQFKDFATKLVPIVTAHLNMAKGLKP